MLERTNVSAMCKNEAQASLHIMISFCEKSVLHGIFIGCTAKLLGKRMIERSGRWNLTFWPHKISTLNHCEVYQAQKKRARLFNPEVFTLNSSSGKLPMGGSGCCMLCACGWLSSRDSYDGLCVTYDGYIILFKHRNTNWQLMWKTNHLKVLPKWNIKRPLAYLYRQNDESRERSNPR